MHEEISAVAVDTSRFCGVCRPHVVERLQLAEMIAAADGAKGGVMRRRREPGAFECARNVSIKDIRSRAGAQRRDRRGFCVRTDRARRAPYAASDVGADKGGVDRVSEHAAANGTIFAGMHVGHAGNSDCAGKRRDVFKLAHRSAFDPGTGRITGMDRRAAGHEGIAHKG